MAGDSKVIYLYNTFYDSFGGSVTFVAIYEMCDYHMGTAFIRVTSPWGEVDNVTVDWDVPFVKTYTNGSFTYKVDHRLFCGMELTALNCNVTYLEAPTTGDIICKSRDESGEISGALIFLDNVNTLLYTPATLIGVEQGSHNITFQKTDYVGCTKTATVVAGSTITVVCTLYKLPTTGSLSITSTPTGAAIFLDTNPTGKLTGDLPIILSDLGPGTHTIVFVKAGYINCTKQVDVILGQERPVHCDLEIIPPGFDINVNIPGLLPNSNLFVMEVSNVPFTDTWWDSPFGAGMKWENITNGIYKAREFVADCEPVPTSHSGFRTGQNYVIYVGTSAISFYPGQLVHYLIDGLVNVDITDSYVDWVSTTVCTAFGITPTNCSNFIFTSINDAAFLLELWTIITKHENLAGESTTPTALDYALIPLAIFGMFSPGISEGAIAQIVGKRLTGLIKISKKGSEDIKTILNDHTLDKFIMRASEQQFDDFARYLEAGNTISAQAVLNTVELAPLSVKEVHALQRGSRLIDQIDKDLARNISLDNLKTVLHRYADNYRDVAIRAMDWARENPKISISVGILAIWFMIDNIPFYIYMYLKAKGSDPSARSWQGKTYIDTIDGFKFNTIEAENLGDWDLFCTNLQLWENEVNEFENFITEYESTLVNEQTFDLYVSTISVYREGILLKNEVHDCGLIELPEVFSAEIIEILDGDTVKILYDETEYSVRFSGINTPEDHLYDYSCTGVREPYLVRRLLTPGQNCIAEETWHVDEAFYISTKNWLSAHLPVGSIATFKTDLERQFDDHGRILAVPFNASNENICLKSLQDGQSVVFFYDNNNKVNQTEFLAAELIPKSTTSEIWTFYQTGTIRCVSYPTAAEVWLDGINTGFKTVNNVYILENVTIGLHTVKFKKIIDDEPSSCSISVIVSLDQESLAECTLSPDDPTIPPEPDEDAIWNINAAKDPSGAILSVAKVYVDTVYIGHYAPEVIKFCNGCLCDTVVQCGYGSHTVTIKKTGYNDWSKTRTLASGDVVTDDPVLTKTISTFPIDIESAPAEASIKVDGILMTPAVGSISVGRMNVIEQILDQLTSK